MSHASELFLICAGITAALQAGFFAYAAVNKTDKVTDLSYGGSFAVIAGVIPLLWNPLSIRDLLVLSAVIIWGVRLSGYLFYRIMKIGTDHRFDNRRENFIAFLSFWSLQALAIYIILLPTLSLVVAEDAAGWQGTDITGFTMFLTGLWIESLADWQKFRFRMDAANQGKFFSGGLFSLIRYPNYAGEILLWWGLFVVAAPWLSGPAFLSAIGPVFITLLLIFGSGIPLLEKSSEKRYGHLKEYQDYRRRSSKLIPFIY